MIANIPKVLLGIFLRFAIAFPVCLYIYASACVAIVCSRVWERFCMIDFFIAPLILIVGPIAHSDEEPPNLYPPILLAAVIVTVIWTVIAQERRRRADN